MSKIIQGDCLEVMRTLDSDSVDAVITDPPYGYSFMGKDWDKAVPSVDTWKECLRVLKPGAFACVMSAPRSDVQMHMIQNLTEAGFRLDFTPIYWTYASGFPKAGNIGKLVDKRLGAEREVIGETNINVYKDDYSLTQAENFADKSKGYEKGKITMAGSSEAKALDGSYAGFQPKPAVEVIIVAMKPLSEKTFVDQALKNGKGISWLDDCRIPTTVEDKAGIDKKNNSFKGANNKPYDGIQFVNEVRNLESNPQGRFPANLLVSDDVLNDGVERKSPSGHVNRKPKAGMTFNTSTSGFDNTKNHTAGHGDSGSYSRYFDLDKWASTLPFLIVPKASKSEKNKGLDSFEKQEPNYTKTYRPTAKASGDKGQNTPYAGTNRGGQMKNGHPTVKPLKLMSYLVTLFSREGDVVLDPFLGSGTTALAAKKLGREYIGIELSQEYVEIAQARLDEKQEALF